MAEKGNINLFTRRARVNNPDGSISTIRSMSFQDPRDKKETLIPQVIKQGGQWKVVNERQAINHYRKTGEHLGKFDTPEEATSFGEMLHTMEALKEKVPTFAQRLGYQQGKKQAEKPKQYSTWGDWANDYFKR